MPTVLRLVMRLMLRFDDEKNGGGAIYVDEVVDALRDAACVVDGVEFDLGASDFTRDELITHAIDLAEHLGVAEEWTEDTQRPLAF